MPLPRFLRYADLVKAGITRSRAHLRNQIRDNGFPPGRLISPNVRAWTEDEIAEYLDSRPVEPKATPPILRPAAAAVVVQRSNPQHPPPEKT